MSVDSQDSITLQLEVFPSVENPSAVSRTLVESRSVDWFGSTLQFGAEGMLAFARSVDSFHQRLSHHDPGLRNDLDFAREHIGIQLNNPLDIRERLLDRVAHSSQTK